MKIIFHQKAFSHIGGMEEVLYSKILWLNSHTDFELCLITLDQAGKPLLHSLPKAVRHIDLDINYEENARKKFISKAAGFLRLRHLHRTRLQAILDVEKPDILISLFPTYSTFIPLMKDGSRKILEFHFSKNFRLQAGRKGMTGLFDKLRTLFDTKIVSCFDRFIVLTKADASLWGNPKNLTVIPNSRPEYHLQATPQSSKRIIAVGRLCYQKGFDTLVKAWKIVSKNPAAEGWTLNIFGSGPDEAVLKEMGREEISIGALIFHGNSTELEKHYAESAFHVMTSRYEGFSLTILEAMTAGLPSIATNCQCGPAELIEDGESGILITPDLIEELAENMLLLIKNPELRTAMGSKARERSKFYDRNVLMHRWLDAISDPFIKFNKEIKPLQ